MKFRHGQSGNPGGRPKVIAEIQELAREHSPTAIETLVSIMRSPKASPAARVAAANSLLDRAYGRPAQKTETAPRSVRELSNDELLAIIAEARPGPASTSHTAHSQ